MAIRFAYPVDLTTDPDGRVVARIADLPGCVTDGTDRAEAMVEVADALEEALADVIIRRQDIPLPSPARGRPMAVPGAVIAGKVALYLALRDSDMTNVALAERLGMAESEVRRMLDPAHATKIGRLEQALAAVGRRLVVTMEAA
ncbi:MAG: type II toxin-antitoxin system HicB family antitoxin [Alphaproteobacteria bacterium]